MPTSRARAEGWRRTKQRADPTVATVPPLRVLSWRLPGVLSLLLAALALLAVHQVAEGHGAPVTAGVTALPQHHVEIHQRSAGPEPARALAVDERTAGHVGGPVHDAQSVREAACLGVLAGSIVLLLAQRFPVAAATSRSSHSRVSRHTACPPRSSRRLLCDLGVLRI